MGFISIIIDSKQEIFWNGSSKSVCDLCCGTAVTSSTGTRTIGYARTART